MTRTQEVIWNRCIATAKTKLANMKSILTTQTVTVPCALVVAMDTRVKELEEKLAAFEGKQ